jgi:hypothetical protein
MPHPRYLLCPQCGAHRFFVKDATGQNVYFHVTPEHQPVPTAASNANLDGLDFSVIYCCGCSWKGPLHKLVPVFRF